MYLEGRLHPIPAWCVQKKTWVPTFCAKVKAVPPEALGALMQHQKDQTGHAYDLALTLNNGPGVDSLVELKRL